MENSGNKQTSSIKAIIDFQDRLSQTEERIIPLYEAIAYWLALGYAEQFNNLTNHQSN